MRGKRSIIYQPSLDNLVHFGERHEHALVRDQKKTLDNSLSKPEWVNHSKEIYRLTMQDSDVKQLVS